MAKANVKEKEVVDILDQDIDISKVEVLLFMLESSNIIDTYRLLAGGSPMHHSLIELVAKTNGKKRRNDTGMLRI